MNSSERERLQEFTEEQRRQMWEGSWAGTRGEFARQVREAEDAVSAALREAEDNVANDVREVEQRNDVGAFFHFADMRETGVQHDEREHLQQVAELINQGSHDQIYTGMTLHLWFDEFGIEHRGVRGREGHGFYQDSEAHTYASTNGLMDGRTPEEHADYLLNEVYPGLLRIKEAHERGLERVKLEHEQAEEKAEALLLEHLDEQQARDWQENHKFSLVAKSGREYTVHRFGSQPVTTDDGHNYCIQSALSDVPAPDVCLARKLLLEADEQKFLEIANDLMVYHRTPVDWNVCDGANCRCVLDDDDVVNTEHVIFVGEGVIDGVMTIDDMGRPVWHEVNS